MKNINKYDELVKNQKKEFHNFPMSFAFSDKQFEEGMKKLELSRDDNDKIASIGGGGFIRKSDINAFNEMVKRHKEEKKQAIKDDKTGEGFIKDMFYRELNNHEYSYTRELDDTLDTLDLTIEDITNNENIKNGLLLAIQEIEKKEVEMEEIENQETIEYE